MDYKNLLIETDNRITTVTINRPKALNALNMETIEELQTFLDSDLDLNKTKVLIITGHGDKSFIAGADITTFVGKNPVTIRPFVLKLQKMINNIEDLPIPVIAKINGYCLGGGLELAMACDIRLASENALLGQPEIKLGLIPGAGGTQRLSRLVGKGFAKELIFTGDNIDPKKAYEIGLVNKVVPLEKLNEETNKIAEKLAKGPAFALNMAKEAINRGTEMSLLDATRMELELFALCFADEDAEEGIQAFINKQKPKFK
ncbi:MAG: enoyl-CoA hydratase/isomerase family protein [Candidatus Hodarchaeales archaeon]